VHFSLTVCLFFGFLFRDERAVLRYHLCSTFSLEKKLVLTLFFYFVDPRRQFDALEYGGPSLSKADIMIS